MKERPILFSTPMVQAVLKGEKTQTRRTRNLDVVNRPDENWWFEGLGPNPEKESDKRLYAYFRIQGTCTWCYILCPYGQPGDLLYVRETWADASFGGTLCPEAVAFKADYSNEEIQQARNKGIWKPSIHMPKSAARIWLQVEEVKVERVQNISTEDMKAEGVRIPVSTEGKICFQIGVKDSAFSFLPDGYYADDADHGTLSEHEHTLYFAFWAELWCEVNGRASWDLNPWVWVVKFNVLSTTGKPQPETSNPKPETK